MQDSRGERYRRLGRGALIFVGYGSVLFWLLLLPKAAGSPPSLVFAWWLLCALGGAACLRAVRRLGSRVAFEILVLGILPLWGVALNDALSPCVVEACDDVGIQRPFATPEIYGLVGLHAMCALAYWVSRRRPEALPAATEAVVLALLATGVGVDAVAVVQTIDLLPFVVALPLTLPLLAPGLGLLLLFVELRARLQRRAGTRRFLWLPLPVLGLYAVLETLLAPTPGALFSVVTRTCSHPLSLGTLEVLNTKHCHYLCTVAARGHARLVRPLGYGVRRGEVILVNRQLQIANAFEDLLRERWPRFARVARALYDRLGLPLSRWIRHPLASDVVYVAMKPAEWAFYVALLLLDRDAPESRIERMYRSRSLIG